MQAKWILGTLAAACIVGGAQAQEVRFTFGTAISAQDLSVQAIQRWKEALESRSDGEFSMDLISGGALGGDQELLQQLISNEVQMHVAGPVIVHRLLPEYQCLEAEYVYEDEAHGYEVWTGEIGRAVSDELKSQYGIEIAAVGARGARQLTSNTPVREPSDLQGVKIRVTNPLRSEIFAAYGALPGPLSMAELYGGLRQGVYDAQENPIGTIYGSKLHEVQTHINLTSHVMSYSVVTANSEFLDSMSEEQRQIFDETLNEAMEWLNEQVATEEGRLLEVMAEETGVEIVEPDVAAFREVAMPIVERFAQENCKPGLLDDIAGQAR